MSIKFIFVLWLFTIQLSEGLSFESVIKRNCNYDGNDISNVNATTDRDCAVLCLKDNFCTHFTWVPTSYWRKPVCFMKYLLTKDDAEKSSKHSNGTSCGLITSKFKTSSNGGIQSDCDYQGMDISNEITDTVKMCKEKCSNDILCTHFTWVPNWKFQQNMCFLKYASTKDEATKSLKINLGTQCGLINAKFEDLWVKGVSFRHNCYYAGQDVDQKRSLTVQQCLLQCSRMSNCTHITWSRNVSSKDAICYFKYAAGGIAWYRETDNDLDKCGTFVTKIDKILTSLGKTRLVYRYNIGIGK